MGSNFDDALQAYFTDVEPLRNLFRRMLLTPRLPRRLLVLHGVGGIGKSSLLRMFRLYCKQANAPVGLVSGDEPDAKSVIGVLACWANDLKADKVTLPTFAKTLEHYLRTQAKVSEQSRKTLDTREKAAGAMSKAATKVIIKGTLGLIPIIGGLAGELVGELGGAGGEVLIDLLSERGFAKTDIDLLRDPTKRLTNDFLSDIEKIATKQRLVLMLDTFEQLSVLEDWARDFAQRLHSNILFVIAGRALPDWNLKWPNWMAQTELHELEPMTEEVMRDLVWRYHTVIRGGEPDPIQVKAIVRFARGLPIVVTSAVQLLVKYKVEDFQAVKPEIVANLVDLLMEGVPKELIPALEAAAILRWFDQPILRAVTGLPDVREIYGELRHFPFVHTKAEGLAFHDAVSEIIDENLRAQDSERHTALHERAAAYFEKQQEKAEVTEAGRLGLEQLYHRIRSNEENGIRLFQQMAEELSRYEFVNGLQILLNDLDNNQLNQPSSQNWRDYYHLRLKMLQGERKSLVDSYRMLVEKGRQPKLLAYALCDLGDILMDRETWRTTNEEAKAVLKRALSLMQKNDPKIIYLYNHLRGYYVFRGQWDESLAILEKRIQLSKEMNSEWGVTWALRDKAFVFGWLGDWRKATDLHEQVRHRLVLLNSSESLKADVRSRPWYLIWSGRYKEAEIGLRDAIEIDKQIGHLEPIWPAKRDLAFSLALQDRFEYGRATFQKLFSHFTHFEKQGELGTLLGFWGFSKAREGDFAQAMNLILKSWEIKLELEDTIGYQETLFWLGYVSELRSLIDSKVINEAEKYYLQALTNKQYGRRYFECSALAGLIRVKHSQGDYVAIPPLLAKAAQFAEQYEYNDHLASLQLILGHLALKNGSRADALSFYKRAMIHALRYNRFLLDELMIGRPQGTHLSPIIPFCLERKEEGRQLLIALHDWWKAGANDIGTPRPYTISPIPEGIRLLEAEKIAREREPGDGHKQKSVLVQLEIVF